VLLLTILTQEDPHVPEAQRVRCEKLPLGFHRVIAQYGFMERPRVLELLRLIHDEDVKVRISETTFFLSRETIVPARRRRMARWRSVLFAFLSRNAQPATTFFGLPANRVVELGVQVEF
jgi:KUP system potassium uptake protein